VLAKKCT